MVNIAAKQETLCDRLDLFKLSPRLGRIGAIGLVSFWGALLLLGTLPAAVQAHDFFIIIGLVISLAALVNVFYLKIRRLNDFNLSGWWILLTFAPMIGYLWALVIYLIPGTKGDNRFGAQQAAPNMRSYLMILSMPIALLVWGWFVVRFGNPVIEHMFVYMKTQLKF